MNNEQLTIVFMEIIYLTENSIKIRTGKTSLVVDPTTKTDADVVILTVAGDYTIPESVRLVIEGSGEYEVGGIVIQGEELEKETFYRIKDETYQVVLLSSVTLAKMKDEDELDALIVKAIGRVDDDVASASASDTVIVYGEEAERQTHGAKKMNRVSLKKKEEEFAGSVILLSK